MPRSADRKKTARVTEKALQMPYSAAKRFASDANLKLSPRACHRRYLEAVATALRDAHLPAQVELVGHAHSIPVGILSLNCLTYSCRTGAWKTLLQWTMHEEVGWWLHGQDFWTGDVHRWAVGRGEILPQPGTLPGEIKRIFLEHHFPQPLMKRDLAPPEEGLIKRLESFNDDPSSQKAASDQASIAGKLTPNARRRGEGQ